MRSNTEVSNNKERIQQLLESSFKKSGTVRSHALTHDELRELRGNLPLLRFEDLRVYLPQLLSDLMEEHADDLLDKKDIYLVIAYLKAPGISDRTMIGEMLGEDHKQLAQQNDECLNRVMSELHSQLTINQCKAIYEWLQFVGALRLLEDFSGDLRESLIYWKKRASGHSPE